MSIPSLSSSSSHFEAVPVVNNPKITTKTLLLALSGRNFLIEPNQDLAKFIIDKTAGNSQELSFKLSSPIKVKLKSDERSEGVTCDQIKVRVEIAKSEKWVKTQRIILLNAFYQKQSIANQIKKLTQVTPAKKPATNNSLSSTPLPKKPEATSDCKLDSKLAPIKISPKAEFNLWKLLAEKAIQQDAQLVDPKAKPGQAIKHGWAYSLIVALLPEKLKAYNFASDLSLLINAYENIEPGSLVRTIQIITHPENKHSENLANNVFEFFEGIINKCMGLRKFNFLSEQQRILNSILPFAKKILEQRPNEEEKVIDRYGKSHTIDSVQVGINSDNRVIAYAALGRVTETTRKFIENERTKNNGVLTKQAADQALKLLDSASEKARGLLPDKQVPSYREQLQNLRVRVRYDGGSYGAALKQASQDKANKQTN